MLPSTLDQPPSFPLNILADFGGGGLTCALGILLALVARYSSGKGQVVQTDMVSGSRYLSSFPLLQTLLPSSLLFGVGPERGTRILDGGCPFYQVYTCKDGQWMTVGCLEPKFFRTFLALFLPALPSEFKQRYGGWCPTADTQMDMAMWPRLREFFELGFKTRPRDEWAAIFHGSLPHFELINKFWKLVCRFRRLRCPSSFSFRSQHCIWSCHTNGASRPFSK